MMISIQKLANVEAATRAEKGEQAGPSNGIGPPIRVWQAPLDETLRETKTGTGKEVREKVIDVLNFQQHTSIYGLPIGNLSALLSQSGGYGIIFPRNMFNAAS
ncbi:hypothetical protein AMTR_s00067p00057180 [Amborella trichopoda]|uniref:Uncharacterized protein n=1 Tax=Amborella trichopoda TaxID=13333 RepID=U5D8G5_AMBTC|nr:hypothetical protein AMTR_s00067p00057180 [Amborella trichopoda]